MNGHEKGHPLEPTDRPAEETSGAIGPPDASHGSALDGARPGGR